MKRSPSKLTSFLSGLSRGMLQCWLQSLPLVCQNLRRSKLPTTFSSLSGITHTGRRFFTVVFTLNFVGLGFAIADLWPYAKKYPGALVLGNLNFAVLMRNEVFGRILYLCVNTCFAKWTPLWFRLGCTSALQHLGGIHSSCAVSGVAWFILMLVNQYNARHLYDSSVLVFGVITVILLFITLLAGLPWVRNTHHNVFERSHRFFGWSALISTWVHTLVSNLHDVADGRWGHTVIYVIRQQTFWYNMSTTVFIFLPWFCTRK